mmetsp:Transcript_2842/g.10330  ORF Transcript_2842/g.10330 Transcript_2842/m.10330 type:complete len:85 (-) Transcript_2842:1232-1486(-)
MDPCLENRTGVHLKDKWRNLLLLAGRSEEKRLQSSISEEIFERVFRLRDKHGMYGAPKAEAEAPKEPAEEASNKAAGKSKGKKK